jgi:hypothetical protein
VKALQVSFVFCGNFGPTRGLEVLIQNWLKCPPNAILYLQGKDNDFKLYLSNLASSKKLVEKKQLFFRDAVEEINIVESLKRYDVGVIPYEPVCLNNKYCCPNKTSQYLKAGLPVLANNLPAVRRILGNNGAGIVVNFRDTTKFLGKVEYFLKEENIAASKKAAERLHNDFCWEKTSEEFYRSLANAEKKYREIKMYKPPIAKNKQHFYFTSLILRLPKKKNRITFSKVTTSNGKNKFISNPKRAKNFQPFIFPFYNSRQLTFSITCLLAAKIIFYLQHQMFRSKNYTVSPIFFPFLRSFKLKVGVTERYYALTKKLISPI